MKKNTKKFLAILLACMMLLPLASCAKDPVDDPNDTDGSTAGTTASVTNAPEVTPDITGNTVALNSSTVGVKFLDERMTATSSSVTCDWSCAGIEFTATCKGDMAINVVATADCNFRAYVDGAVYKNGDSDYYTATKGGSQIVLKDIPEGTHTIRIVKVTGYTLANAELTSIVLDGTVSETAPADKELFIEFIGDSISCGWGVVGTYDGKYTAQDGTLAYPYLVAEAMNADYSVVALSGQGVMVGNPGIALGYKYASPGRSQADEYSFTRKANVVVVNVGTNDYYQKTMSGIDEASFRSAFKAFMEYVREKNGEDCKILAVYNMMNDGFGENIANVMYNMGGVAQGYYSLKLDTCAGVNSAHPSAEEQAAYAVEIKAAIDTILAGEWEEEEVLYPPAGDTIYEQDFEAVDLSGYKKIEGNPNYVLAFDGDSTTDRLLSCPTPKGWAVFEIVGADLLKNTQKYTFEATITAEDFKLMGFVFNGQEARPATNYCKLFFCDTNASHSVITVDQASLLGYDRNNNADTKIGTQSVTLTANKAFELKMTVDNTVASGCDVTVEIDGVVVGTFNFTLKTTENSGIGLWYEGNTKPVTFDNIKVTAADGTVIYAENYDVKNPATTDEVNAMTGFETVSGTPVLKVEDATLSIQNNELAYTEIVDSKTLNASSVFTMEMELSLTQLKRFGILFNHTAAWESGNPGSDYNILQFAFANGAAGTIGTHDVVLEAIRKTGGVEESTAFKSQSVKDLLTGGKSFKLSIVFDNRGAGCNVIVNINGEFVASYGFSHKITEHSAIILFAEGLTAPVLVDNVVLTEGVVQNFKTTSIVPTIPTNTTVIYQQNFDTATTAAEAGVTNLFDTGLPLSIENGALSVGSVKWSGSTGGVFATLIGNEAFKNAPETYIVEMELTLKEMNVFGFYFNSNNNMGTTEKEMRQSALLVTLRMRDSAGSLKKGTVTDAYDLHFRIAKFDANGSNVKHDDDNYDDAFATDITASPLTVKLTMVVDSSPTNGCTVNLFIDGIFVYGFTYENTWDVSANSSLVMWAQETAVVIDNIVVSVPAT